MAVVERKFSQTAMELLKSNLVFFGSKVPPDLDVYLESLLDYAHDDFERMGIRLIKGTIKDDMDQAVHAAWMYRNGVTGANKNEMLKAIIRNRQVGQALADEGADA